ncbi:putative Zinc finger, MIZ-type, Zinc finger, RING/FYVE/PHD-type [Helianthus annuus]|nr:putative Zinc finger, MIZ-type, Zinc finger, RING/FYVE/PHD-type [Helianthus annuus]KAJ0531075.1 putative Zinc finger, MIZ-type, Zinc finger, RING/FYVE/PHD-type [Helianthus annuus]KAJ0697922.1 putative Zinc finger, MIZ-type, Zinc finger, RING/FYVE/PHD-type [Helianthus annuus]KAJ0701287.1 putative Zinc finger, MIZ-type, Zinc finger, RING/FYVE/PHD-type [Helianthus annuus]
MLQMSGSRMKIDGRFKPCAHIGCFDIEVFLEMNQRSRKVDIQIWSKLLPNLPKKLQVQV